MSTKQGFAFGRATAHRVPRPGCPSLSLTLSRAEDSCLSHHPGLVCTEEGCLGIKLKTGKAGVSHATQAFCGPGAAQLCLQCHVAGVTEGCWAAGDKESCVNVCWVHTFPSNLIPFSANLEGGQSFKDHTGYQLRMSPICQSFIQPGPFQTLGGSEWPG